MLFYGGIYTWRDPRWASHSWEWRWVERDRALSCPLTTERQFFTKHINTHKRSVKFSVIYYTLYSAYNSFILNEVLYCFCMYSAWSTNVRFLGYNHSVSTNIVNNISLKLAWAIMWLLLLSPAFSQTHSKAAFIWSKQQYIQLLQLLTVLYMILPIQKKTVKKDCEYYYNSK